jgi:multicomponent Na+:H+ antiporter subunit B
MNTVILRTACGPLVVLLLAFAAFLLLRGHNAPGGGFIAGLVVAGAAAFQVMSFPRGRFRRRLAGIARTLLGIGLATALGSTAPAAFLGLPPLTGVWTPGSGEGLTLGTPLLFDVGVCATVSGFLLLCLVELERR